jgi:hypothetical protein
VRTWVACAMLAAALSCVPAAAQKATEAEAHVTSAFTSGADHGVLASSVTLGPALRQALGGETDSRKIYNALIDRVVGKPLRVTLLTPSQAVDHASLAGVKAGEPLLRVEAGDVVLLLQYAANQRGVTFVEQLGSPAPRVEAPKPEAQAPKAEVELPKPQAQEPAPVTTIPLPTEPPAPLVAPAPLAIPAPAAPAPAAPALPRPAVPAPAVVQKPKPPAVAVQKVPPPAAPRAEKPVPRGECVVKPVMSDEDLRNCAGVSASRSTAAIERPAVVVEPAAAGSAPIAAPAARPRPDCVIKPVMTDEDMRNCAAVSTSRARMAEPAAPAVAVQTSAPPAATPKLKPECVIKPVMSDEDLRACR